MFWGSGKKPEYVEKKFIVFAVVSKLKKLQKTFLKKKVKYET